MPEIIYAIAGPTASGKTALGVKLAKAIGGEVVNFDSVQVYKGIQVATAKPSEEEKQGIPHHLIGYVDPNVSYTAADWADDAANVIEDIESRGAVPILVGGTGFYLWALQNPLFESPKTDHGLRSRLSALVEAKGSPHVYRMLRRLDPEAAGKLFENDAPRIVRALEVIIQTGERFSRQQPIRSDPPKFAARIKLFVLNPPRDVLYEKINRRTEQHFSSGLVEEVKQLRAEGVSEAGRALGAHGYRRVCEYIRGERSLESAIERSKQDVRNYAKRQLTWFRRETDAIWLDGFGDEDRVFKQIRRTTVSI